MGFSGTSSRRSPYMIQMLVKESVAPIQDQSGSHKGLKESKKMMDTLGLLQISEIHSTYSLSKKKQDFPMRKKMLRDKCQ